MLHVIGNLWSFQAAGFPVCVTTNGVVKKNGELVMGAGIALQAKNLFPAIPLKAGNAVKTYGNQVYYFTEENLFTFPTKHHWREDSDIDLIKASCWQISAIAYAHEFNRIYLPRPGCANGGLEWSYVESIIGNLLDDRFTVVSLY